MTIKLYTSIVFTFFLTSNLKAATQAESQKTQSKKIGVESMGVSNWSSFYNYSYRHFLGEESRNFFPEKLDVTYQLMGVSYNLSKNLKLALTGSYIKNDIVINLPKFMGGDVTSRTRGWGDTYLGVYNTFDNIGGGSLEISAQVSLPTGAVDLQKDNGELVSYPGQLGSGTYDFVPYIKFKKKVDQHKLNLQAQSQIRTGRNEIGYRLGDNFSLRASYEYWWLKWLNTNVKFSYKTWQSVRYVDKVAQFNTLNKKISSSPRKSRDHAPGSHGGGTGRPSSSSKGIGKTGKNPYAGLSEATTGDVFADAGSRWSTSLGLKSAIYLGKGKLGVLELGKPIHADQAGSLEGLSTDWFGSANFVVLF